MAYYAFHVNALSLPFANNVNAKLFKLYSLDSGLVCYMTLARRQFEVMNGQIDINEGALAEEFVAAEFAKKGYNLYYYDKKSKHELDFLLADGDGIDLVEVKSGNNYRSHASLDYALANSSDCISRANVLCKGNLSVEGRICYLPLYMTMFM